MYATTTHMNKANSEPNPADKTDDDNEHGGEADFHDRAKKCLKGFILIIIISNLWAVSLHMIKMCYVGPNELIMYNNFLKAANTSDEYFNNLNVDNQLFDHVINLDTAAIVTTAKSITTTLKSNKTTNRNLLRSRNKQQILEKRYDFTSKIHFNAPFFIAWYCSLFNILFLPLYAIFRMSCIKQNESVTIKKIFLESIHHFIDRDFTTIQFFSRCILFCSLWTLANYLLIYGIRKLDPTVSMALFASSVNFIYFLSWVVLHHQFVGIRIVAAIVCTTGVSLLAYMNRIDRPTTFNVVIGTLAACAAATYKVFYRRIIGYTTFAQTALFFTIIGLLNALFIWPIVILLYLTGVEVYKTENIPWLYLNIAATLNLLANLLGNIGIMFTYELFLTLGIFFSIPISYYIDSYLFAVVFQGKKLIGIVLIAISFLVVLLPENWNKYLIDVMRTNVNKWKLNEQKKKNARKIQDTSTGTVFKLRTPSGRVK